MTQRRRLSDCVDVPFESTPLTLEHGHSFMLTPASLWNGPSETSGVFIRVSSVCPFARLREFLVELMKLIEVVRLAGIVTLRSVGSVELFLMPGLCCCFPFRFHDCHEMSRLQVFRRGPEVFDNGVFCLGEGTAVQNPPPLLHVSFRDATIVDERGLR